MYLNLPVCIVTAAMIFTSIQVHAQDAAKQPVAGKMLPVIQTMPDGLLGLAKQKQGAVFSLNQIGNSSKGSMNKGFFIDGSGLALCSLSYLCCDVPTRFDGSNGELLDTPKVLGVFADHHLALVKFAYKPKVWLEISDKLPAAGEWIALISTLRDPDPLVSPVLAWRDQEGFEATVFHQTAKMFSFASGRSPTQRRLFAIGAPMIDETGKVISVYAGQELLNVQALRFARPLEGIANSIKAALGKPLDLPIPIPRKFHHYDPVRLDPLWLILQESPEVTSPDLLRNVQKLLLRYPESRVLKESEWGAKWQALTPGPALDLFLDATLRSKPPENAPALEQAAYFERLAKIHMFRPGKEADAMDAYRKAFELSPQAYHNAGANLAAMHLRRGELKESERLYRTVISFVPERIDYIEGLQKVLSAKGDWKGDDELSPWIWKLEDLYRSH